jgi:hypothetical protein
MDRAEGAFIILKKVNISMFTYRYEMAFKDIYDGAEQGLSGSLCKKD